MSRLNRLTLAAVVASSVIAGAPALAQDRALAEEMVIIGKSVDAQGVAGSAYVITELELQKFEYSDIHRIMRQVPGVYFREEEGYGLRPNIGIRGSGSGRNAKITVMEDGVLVAPAPYADPAAYYFPTTARIHGVEVLKGPQALAYGPYTVGGAINLLSTPIPRSASGFAGLEVGGNGEQRLHAGYGASSEQWGFLVETHQHKADGFHDIDRSSRDSGFDKEDYVAKLRWRSAADAAYRQQVDLKVNYAEETSNTSYLGVTDAQFKHDPYRRYGVTDLDRMNNRQTGVVLRHSIELANTLGLTTTLYRNEFERSWYKADSIGGQSLSGIIGQANGGSSAALAILEGDQDVSGIRIKNNAREYVSEGVQLEFDGGFDTGGLSHSWVAGVRWHEDESDREQPIDVFDQVNGSLVYQSTILPISASGSGDNRIDAAEALSGWFIDRISLGAVELTASLRYEDIDTESKRYTDLDRNTVGRRDSNSVDEVLAGLGATWQVDERWLLLGGVHQGFAPAGGGAADGTEPEESVNYEFGVRYRTGHMGVDAIGFYSDYKNTVNNCTVANPCAAGRDFGTQGLGEAEVRGLELAANANLMKTAALTVPLRVAYTYTDGEISRDSDTGNVLKGDNLQYLPEHMFNVSLGLDHVRGWSAYVSASFVDETCIDNQCDRSGSDNRFRKADDYWVLDASASYPLSQNAEIYARVDNLLDDESIVARSPAGARVNKPRTAYVGLRLQF